ncbi:MAG TPA: SRPBCC family protein [Lacunisphaera sp.]|jgi:uncharacterized protein YndB with AHSA1/START domain|nr:SRPBCC family protein [Lacunisphaera sp.]
MNLAATTSLATRELSLSRLIPAPPAVVYHAWVTRFTHWWGPHGMTTPACEMDLRPGGVFRTIMRAPDGGEFHTKGVFLEVIPGKRIVFTDAFAPGWEPDADIFFTAIITFDAVPDGGTCCTARALHWNKDARDKHERLGFHQGWGESLDRLADLIAHLPSTP